MESSHPDLAHHEWITQRVAQRNAEYPLPRQPATFDILTLVYETDAAILRKTAASVIAQDAHVWRWVICDNGSTSEGTRDVLRDLACHPNIDVEWLPKNLGMVEGHRRGLELCTADYVAFLDHDDVLTVDALRVTACIIERFDRPDFLYSDEDKCDIEERRFAPLFKPDFSPALLNDVAYTCHMSVVKREQLRGCGAFTDPGVEGTQDWDMALRLFEIGCRIVHIPEILYSWRALPTSTAMTLLSKPYVLDAQLSCLRQHLQRQGLAERFDVIANPAFPEPDGHWWIRRLAVPPEPSVDVVVLDTQVAKGVREITDYGNFHVRVAADGSVGPAEADFIALVPAGGELLSPGWLREALGLFELVRDAAIVCGQAGAESAENDPGYSYVRWCRRDAAAVAGPWVGRADAITAVGGLDASTGDLEERLRSAGWRIVTTPFLTVPVP